MLRLGSELIAILSREAVSRRNALAAQMGSKPDMNCTIFSGFLLGLGSFAIGFTIPDVTIDAAQIALPTIRVMPSLGPSLWSTPERTPPWWL